MELKDKKGKVIYTDYCNSYIETVNGALANNISLKGVDLSDQNLEEVDFSNCDLRSANFGRSILKECNFTKAVLTGAFFEGADLTNVCLQGAQIKKASFQNCKIKGVEWPSPSEVLLASWGLVSDELCADLMIYDSQNHPDPSSFTAWAKGCVHKGKEYRGPCPYEIQQKFEFRVERAAHFQENTRLWDPSRPPCRPYDLMVRVLREKCIL